MATDLGSGVSSFNFTVQSQGQTNSRENNNDVDKSNGLKKGQENTDKSATRTNRGSEPSDVDASLKPLEESRNTTDIMKELRNRSGENRITLSSDQTGRLNQALRGIVQGSTFINTAEANVSRVRTGIEDIKNALNESIEKGDGGEEALANLADKAATGIQIASNAISFSGTNPFGQGFLNELSTQVTNIIANAGIDNQDNDNNSPADPPDPSKPLESNGEFTSGLARQEAQSVAAAVRQNTQSENAESPVNPNSEIDAQVQAATLTDEITAEENSDGFVAEQSLTESIATEFLDEPTELPAEAAARTLELFASGIDGPAEPTTQEVAEELFPEETTADLVGTVSNNESAATAATETAIANAAEPVFERAGETAPITNVSDSNNEAQVRTTTEAEAISAAATDGDLSIGENVLSDLLDNPEIARGAQASDLGITALLLGNPDVNREELRLAEETKFANKVGLTVEDIRSRALTPNQVDGEDIKLNNFSASVNGTLFELTDEATNSTTSTDTYFNDATAPINYESFVSRDSLDIDGLVDRYINPEKYIGNQDSSAAPTDASDRFGTGETGIPERLTLLDNLNNIDFSKPEEALSIIDSALVQIVEVENQIGSLNSQLLESAFGTSTLNPSSNQFNLESDLAEQLAKNTSTVLQQAGGSIPAQANVDPDAALSLLLNEGAANG